MAKSSVTNYGIAVSVATGYGVGWVPHLGSTLGTLLGLPLAWGIAQIHQPVVEAVVTVLLCLLSVPIAQAATVSLGRGKDPRCIVLDELVSVPLTFLWLPWSNITFIAAGFVLLRVIDITKPPPARWLERLPGGWGVMADDWAAAVYANLLLHGLLWSAPSWFAS